MLIESNLKWPVSYFNNPNVTKIFKYVGKFLTYLHSHLKMWTISRHQQIMYVQPVFGKPRMLQTKCYFLLHLLLMMVKCLHTGHVQYLLFSMFPYSTLIISCVDGGISEAGGGGVYDLKKNSFPDLGPSIISRWKKCLPKTYIQIWIQMRKCLHLHL